MSTARSSFRSQWRYGYDDSSMELPTFYYGHDGFIRAALVAGEHAPFGISVYRGQAWHREPIEFKDRAEAMRYGETIAVMEGRR